MKRQILLMFLLTAALAGCGGEGDKKSAAGAGGPGPAAMPPPEVDVITVASGTATLTQDLPGRLQAWRTAQVRARVEGVVEKRLFIEGSDVKEGATLFQIDARTYQATLDAARADVDAARLVVERYRPLLAIRAVSQQELDSAEARHKQAQAAMARASLDVENTRVPAPISGRIGRALVTEGALVGRGEATHLATIEQTDPIYANFTQPGAEMLRLQSAVKSGKLKRAESAAVELLLEDGSAYPQQVKTGGMAGGDFIIAEGLKGGEQVIVNGLQKARPGTEVKAVPWNPQPATQPVGNKKKEG